MPSRHSTTGTFASGTSGSRRFSLTLLHERIWRRIRCVIFARLLISLISHCQQSPRILCPRCFCSLILDHGVLLKISTSGPKIIISNFLLDTSLHHSFQSVIIRSSFLLMSLQVIHFQYGLEFPDSRILDLYNPSKMSSDGILRH